MNTQKHILVVEDNPIIYNEVTFALEEAGFKVDSYTESVKKALSRIHNKRPDIVLLDIDLKGAENGIYLGHLLKTEYKIPFIYVTDYNDSYTFNQSAQTDPESFMAKQSLRLTPEDVVVRTKPSFDEKHLIRQITLILQRQDKNTSVHKDGIMAFVDLPKNITNAGFKEITECPIKYNDIELITSTIIDIDFNTLSNNRREELKKEGRNIAKIITIIKEPYLNNGIYYCRGNLTTILENLPYNFVRINSSQIINLTLPTFEGRINTKRIMISNKVYTISNTYKDEFEKRLKHFY